MRILVVCLGNICRSPLAHGCLESLIEKAGLNWEVDSAGTGNWHIGCAPDPRAIRVAKENSINIGQQRARQFMADDFDRYDLILTMDSQNYKDVLRLAKNDEQRKKVRLFLSDKDVQDPYFDDKLFDPVFDIIYRRSQDLINEFSN